MFFFLKSKPNPIGIISISGLFRPFFVRFLRLFLKKQTTMRIQLYAILVFITPFTLRLQAQQLTTPQALANSVIVKNDCVTNGNDNVQNIQLRISHMSNRMIWLQQKLKDEASLESNIREQYVEELSTLIKARGDLMQITRQMIRSKNVSGKLVLF
jgi:hypothetical protein